MHNALGILLCCAYYLWMELLTGTVLVNKLLLARTVMVNKILFAGTPKKVSKFFPIPSKYPLVQPGQDNLGQLDAPLNVP